MEDKIPIMKEQKVKEDYARLLSERLGASSKLHIFPAAITSALIVGRKNSQLSPNHVDRIYVLGVPQNDEYCEERGIGIMHNLRMDNPIYGSLLEKGYSPSYIGHPSAFRKLLDTTDEVVAELKTLEELFYI